EDLLQRALKVFYELRNVKGLKKKPSTSELLDWLKLIILERIGLKELEEVNLKDKLPPFEGALIKNEQDYQIIEQLRKWSR
ncbi:MAG: ATP-binding protein, partial [Bacteroidota bacterium]